MGLAAGLHFTVAAYGQVLAVHAANAALSGTSEAAFKSNLGYSGEQWDASLRMQNLRARAYDPRNGRFIGLDPFAGNMQDPQSLHKYAYVHGDPIQGIDPSGLFSQKFGYWVEEAIARDYQRQHQDVPIDVTFGGWAQLGQQGGWAFMAKPDILNHTDMTYMEIKPLSISGLILGEAQMLMREVQLGPFGYEPDGIWASTPQVTFLQNGIPIVYVNFQGLVLYTDVTELLEDYAAIKMLGMAGFWKFLATKGSSVLTSIGTQVAGLVNSGNGARGAQASGQLGIASMFAGMGVAI